MANLDLGDGISFFGIFAGHGGKNISNCQILCFFIYLYNWVHYVGPEVAFWVAQNICDELKTNPNYKAKNWEATLKEVFLSLDNKLKDENTGKELIKIAKEKEQVLINPRGDNPS